MSVSTIVTQKNNVQIFSFKSNKNQSGLTKQQTPDQFTSEQKTTNKKRTRSMWKTLATFAVIFALIADIIVEHRIRVSEKAKIESLRKEKELAEKLKKEAEEQSKKLEEEINKQKEILEKSKTNGSSSKDGDPPEIKF